MISRASERKLPESITAILLCAAISYNAALAIVNAHVTGMSLTQVALCESILLVVAACVALSRGVPSLGAPCVLIGAGFFVGALFLSFVNGALVVEALRNVTIIVIFTMLGLRMDQRGIRVAFGLIVALVLGVMLLELCARDLYAGVFKPFLYYQNTRGIGEIDYEDTGLFGNALGFEGRFSFGVFTTPRTSSIFLEQTSLANFASVIVVYLVSMWPSLGRAEKTLFVSLVLLALMSNNTRMASAFAAISIFGYFAYPRLPRFGTLLLPLITLGLAVVATGLLGPSKEDDFAGRLGLSIHLLSLTDLPGSLGARAFETGQFPDSGYSYVLYSSSIIGAIALWLYVALIVPFGSDSQKRCAWSISIFFFMNLLIAGNAIFSMKVAAPLWMLAGFMRSLGPAPGLPSDALAWMRRGATFAAGRVPAVAPRLSRTRRPAHGSSAAWSKL